MGQCREKIVSAVLDGSTEVLALCSRAFSSGFVVCGDHLDLFFCDDVVKHTDLVVVIEQNFTCLVLAVEAHSRSG